MDASSEQVIRLEEGQDTNALFEKCLGCSDVGIVSGTVRNMDGTMAAELVRKLVTEISSQMRPTMAIWLHWIIVTHGGYLASVQDLQEPLNELHAKLIHGGDLLMKISALSGRLSMVLGQAEIRESRRLDQEESSEEESEYEDGQNSDYDIEVVDENEDELDENEDEEDAAAAAAEITNQNLDEDKVNASLSPDAELSPRRSSRREQKKDHLGDEEEEEEEDDDEPALHEEATDESESEAEVEAARPTPIRKDIRSESPRKSMRKSR
ncbi:ribonucleoprotein complex [Schizosaccharomyces cryophilus OY26]|uniref:Ribonucleoprotein complex n=1 Tax=Schizosaccharomyces cryophilus (strain OY26 / ATCC MYA-4695 / CBS 11777 / NBRC 106824 / NRRL Y48691) TaxID=653667 RepID=S9W1V6_SCHCR|nr:ribonucleoprotein complex [Schizosaccharomyces cryophilus OY26]EPY52010.1 ribonucleoprotein complex [Schizosaccharomyces cryophilus OY26]